MQKGADIILLAIPELVASDIQFVSFLILEMGRILFLKVQIQFVFM